MERPIASLGVHDAAVTVPTRPYEIKTVRVELNNSEKPRKFARVQ